MTFEEFLNLTKVIRMLYGKEIAVNFFENNIDRFYKLQLKNLLDADYLDTLTNS